ncbi:MAG: DUF962 domain-containing protein [Stenotrophobium sp.]
MKTLNQWLNEYSESHLNPVNKTLHWLCIPQIVFAIWCGLKAIPLGGEWINPATVIGVLALAYYVRLSWRLALGVAGLFVLMYAGVVALQHVSGPYFLWVAAAIFIEALVGQFIGHHYEGARPSFFKDLQFLMIGPLWLLADVYRRLSIPVQRRAAI